ncbi:MAG: hypothetical protein ACI9EW_002629 [Cellvibrionaceae bacterium]|jgi:hypothetical protein
MTIRTGYFTSCLVLPVRIKQKETSILLWLFDTFSAIVKFKLPPIFEAQEANKLDESITRRLKRITETSGSRT